MLNTIFHITLAMCTTTQYIYRRCKQEDNSYCNHTDYIPCELDMCRGKHQKHVTRWKEEKCPEHKKDELEKRLTKKRGGDCKEKTLEEWPEVDCKAL
jgi:hypothetical protein